MVLGCTLICREYPPSVILSAGSAETTCWRKSGSCSPGLPRMTALLNVGTVAPATGASGFAVGPQSVSWACWVSRHPDGLCAVGAGRADPIGLDIASATVVPDPADVDSEPAAGRDAAHTPADTTTHVMTNAAYTVERRDEESTGSCADVPRRRAPVITRSANQHNDAARTTVFSGKRKRLTSSQPPSSATNPLSADVAATRRRRGSSTSCDPGLTARCAQYHAVDPVEQTRRTLCLGIAHPVKYPRLPAAPLDT